MRNIAFSLTRRALIAAAGGVILFAGHVSLAEEALVLQVSGSFEARPGAQYDTPAEALYDVSLPSRGWFRSEVEGSPGIFGGPSGNDPNYHFSTQLDRVGDVTLRNFTTTDIETPPVVTGRNSGTDRLIPSGGIYQARVLGPNAISFTFGDFLFGDAQSFTARGYFDPSPIADAGPVAVIEGGAPGVLLGAGSDVDGDSLTYSWTRLFGPNLGLSDSTAAQPTFTAPNVTNSTTTRMQLIVSDAHSASLPSTVDVLIYPPGGNIPPLVNAGPGDVGDFDTVLSLDGSQSSDFDGAVRLFSWTQIGGPRVELSDPAASDPTFKQYDPLRFDQGYTFELVVSDGRDLSAPDTVTFTVTGYGDSAVPLGPNETRIFNASASVPEVTQISGDPAATVNSPPIAVPGPGRLRTEVLGTPALFGGPDGNNPNFHLSSHGVRWDGIGTTGFQQTDIETAPVITNTFFNDASGGSRVLTVVGPQALSFTFLDFLYGEAQSFDVNVWFRPASQAPTANAGPPQTAESGEVVQLDGKESTDPDGDPLSYQWTQTSGPSVTLSNPNSPVPLFKAPSVTGPTALEFALVVNDGQASAPDTTTVTVNAPTTGPRLVAATVAELQTLDLSLAAGDQILLTFDQPATVSPSPARDSDWFLTNTGATFGSGSSVAPSSAAPNVLVITLGSSFAGLVVRGDDPASATAIDIAAGNPLGIFNPRSEAPAVDGGVPGVDDEAIDLRWRYAAEPTTIGRAGGAVQVLQNLPSDPLNYELTRPRLVIPPNALTSSAQFAFQALPPGLAGRDLVTAITIATDAPHLFAVPAKLVLEYLDADIDYEAGQVEGLVRAFQITDMGPVPLGASATSGLPLVPGILAVNQDGTENTVAVQIDSLDPSSSGTVGVFATLPVNPIEERTINIKPSGAGSAQVTLPVPTASDGPELTPDAGSGYLLHTIEFPNHVTTDASDPQRIQVKIRTATLFDRTTPSPQPGANVFPGQSAALFVVETRGASGSPVQFTSPVNLSVQFIPRTDSSLTDTVQFDGTVGQPGQMRIARSRVGSILGPDYQFIGDTQTVDRAAGLVSASSITPLTDANGQAAWGAVIDPSVDVITLSELINHILGVTTLTGDKFDQADVNGDGARDAADVVALLLTGGG